jgi:pantoate--beta-alanine ligase
VQVARTIAEFERLRDVSGSRPHGFVPTMGALHAGHTSLIDAARARDALVSVSIFVNPTQFGPNEDFERYPRDEERDFAMCEAAGTDLIFAPTVEEMYPPGESTVVRVGDITDRLEGAHRPGHFDGVTTVVAKLLSIVWPDRAYFGNKDAQQIRTVRRMVRDLRMPMEIVGCPIVREEDGLALSSRNVYLGSEERSQALSLSHGLRLAAGAFADGERDAGRLRAIVRGEVEAQPLARIDYVSLAESDTLVELDGAVQGEALLSLAVSFGGTRLIDNTVLVD